MCVFHYFLWLMQDYGPRLTQKGGGYFPRPHCLRSQHQLGHGQLVHWCTNNTTSAVSSDNAGSSLGNGITVGTINCNILTTSYGSKIEQSLEYLNLMCLCTFKEFLEMQTYSRKIDATANAKRIRILTVDTVTDTWSGFGCNAAVCLTVIHGSRSLFPTRRQTENWNCYV